MSHKPSNAIMTHDEMVAMNKERKLSRLYTKSEEAGECIQTLIQNATTEIVNMSDKISLADTATVKRVTEQYLCACEEVNCLPSKMGLARSFGVSRQAIDSFMARNPEHETTEFLQIVFDTFSEVLSNAALNNSVNMVYTIFVQKAIFGLKEAIQIETVQNGPLSTDGMTAEDVARRYSELPED